jgi:hypothetical protein
VAAAQAAAATTNQEQEAFVVIVATTRKTLDEARARRRSRLGEGEDHRPSSSLPLPNKSQSPRTTMKIAPSTPAPTAMLPSPLTCMHRLPASRIYDRWSRSFWNPHRPTISGGVTSCFSRCVATPSTTTFSLTSPIHPSIGLDRTTSWCHGSSTPSPPNSTRSFGSQWRLHARRGS